MVKKTIPALLALLMIIPMIVACGNTGNSDTTTPVADTVDSAAPGTDEGTKSTVDENGYLLDDIPAGLKYNEEINIFYWTDYTMTEFFVEDSTGDNISNAIYSRNLNVEDRLGVTLSYYGEKGGSDSMNAWIQKAETDWKGSHEFDIYAGYSRSAPQLAYRGYNVNLLTTEHFDVEKPWWPEALMNECTFGNKLYFCSGDISTNMLWMMIGTFYNKSMYEARMPAGTKTPEQMVDDKEWTMDVMFNMTKDIYEDTDGDTAVSAGDTYGFVIYETNIDAFQTAAGIVSIEKAIDGTLSLSSDWLGERCATLCKTVGDYLKSPGVYHKNSTSIRTIFNEERALFITDRCFIVAGKDNASSKDRIEFEYGIIPQPMMNADQGFYLTNMGHPYTMYAVSSNSSAVEASATVIECMGSLNYRSVTPQVFESAMKLRYATGGDAARMYDILRGTVSFDLGRIMASNFGNTTANAFRTTALSSPDSYASKLKAYKSSLEGNLKTFVGTIEGLE